MIELGNWEMWEFENVKMWEFLMNLNALNGSKRQK